MLKLAVVVVLIAATLLVVASAGRSILSHERAQLDARVVAFEILPGDEARNLPLGGDVKVAFADGRTVSVPVPAGSALTPGKTVRLSERIAPWGEVWYRLAE